MAKAMAFLGLKSVLFILVVFLTRALGEPGSSCLSVTPGPDAWAAATCSIDSLEDCKGKELSGDVFVLGNGTSTWDVEARPLRFANGSRVTVSCVRILLERSGSNVTQLLPVNYTSLLHPPFLRSPSETPLAALTLRDVEISLSCDVLLEWQRHLCGVQLPGKTLVLGNTVSILSWRGTDAVLERVNLTCNPGRHTFSPACSMAVVVEVTDILDILDASSRLQDPYLPLVMTVSRDLSFNDSKWPDSGLQITANVTLSAILGSNVRISFGLKTLLFNVDKNSYSTAFLSFRGCILVDLPLTYLPINHPRRPFGVLSTALWPVYREEVAMGLYDCTLILTDEEFKFWSYWLTILVSPIPGVSMTGNWTYANEVKLGKSGLDYIHLMNYMGRYTTLINVRYQIANNIYATQQRNNILQITDNESVPPTVVFQTRDSNDLLYALLSSPSQAAAQHGQYIILTENVVVDNLQWPAQGAPISYPTTITTWPSSWVALDLKLLRDAFLILPSPSSSVVIKNMVLLNLAVGELDNDFGYLTTGLWAFNFSFSNWRYADQQRISLDRAVMVVSREEVKYYIDATVNQTRGNSWISSFQVGSYDHVNSSWVHFTALATTRFSAQSLNITVTIPVMLNRNSINITTVTGLPRTSLSDVAESDSRREMLLFVLLVITLPTAIGAALLTYIVIKRRRIARLCKAEGASNGKESKHSGGDEEGPSVREDRGRIASRNQEPPVCCFPLSLPLRKSKFVNPLYDDAGRAPPEIVLTGVLGPAALARSLAPVATAASGTLSSHSSISTIEDLDLELDAVAATAAKVRIEQDAASSGTRSNGACSSRVLGVLSAAPVELRQGGDSADGLAAAAAAAAESGVSSLSERCMVGVGLQTETRGRSSASIQPAATGGAGGGPCGQGSGGGSGTSSAQVGELHFRPAAAAVALVIPSSAPWQAAALGRGEDADASMRRQALQGRPDIGYEALEGGSGHTRFIDMQQLDRLRHEIGDRHLEMQHSLGWGGCGVVYKGVWKGLQVAVKTILLQGDSKQSQQFLTEAAISASLQHANIVTTYLYELRPLDEVDPGTGNVEIQVRATSSDEAQLQEADRISCWKLYIVQEYCELGTLKAAIDQGYFKGPAAPNLAFLLTMALDMALGLAHVHSKNVVHGDVTVSNVLLQACPGRPQGCIAKLADFGLSVKFEADQTQGYDLYGGTPHYMAPERIRGVLSKRSDIYSLGVCLWELYCGTPPWRRNAASAHHRGYGGGTTSSSVDSGGHHQHHAFGDPASGPGASDSFRFPRGCLPEYSTLVLSCLSTEPQARPTASTVASTLERLHRRYC